MEHTFFPFVSVIVPVYKDVRLAQCLKALADQTYPGESYEIIVVDNGGGGAIAPMPMVYPNVTVHYEPARGSYAARNRGVLVARGEILAFTDADCIPDRNWLEAGVKRLGEDDEPDIIGGEIRLFPQDPGSLTAAELFESVWSFPQQKFIEEKHFAATANLFVRRKTFDNIGPFNGQMMSGGDVDWGRRAHQTGKSMIFASNALVYHPARRSLLALATKKIRTCGGRYQLRRIYGEREGAVLASLIQRPFTALFVRNTLTSPLRQRLRYAGVELLLSTVQLLELARLACGGEPRRW